MGNVSTEWLAAISTGRDYSIDEKKKGCAVPVTPWLHPPVGKRLRDLITKLGTVRELERQEILYPQGRKVSDIVLVQQGVTARNFGNAVSGPKAAAVIMMMALTGLKFGKGISANAVLPTTHRAAISAMGTSSRACARCPSGPLFRSKAR